MAFTQILVTGTFLESDGETPASGTVTFVATNVMRDTSTNQSVVPTEIVAELDVNGEISVLLTATNDLFTTPKGTLYEVTERLDDAAENKYFISIDRNAISGTVDLADLVPNIPTVSTQNYATQEYVNSVVLGDIAADQITFDPTDEIASTDVQGAIEEVRAKSKYVHTQPSAATIWTITHNLKFFPNVTVVDSGENYVVGDVEYLSNLALRITFAHSFAGKAYLS
jgi:hypothetical protein